VFVAYKIIYKQLFIKQSGISLDSDFPSAKQETPSCQLDPVSTD
jgi:hypothetical protein